MKHLFICCICILFCSGCATKNRGIEKDIPEQELVQTRIFVLGDSLSAGYQLPLEQSYPMILEKKLQSKGFQVKLINGGESGDTSAGLKERVGWITADAQSGDIVLIVIGANDGLQGLSVKELEKNIFDITKILQSRGLLVIIGGIQLPTNLGDDYRKEFAALYPRVTEQTQSVLIPFILTGVAGNPSLNLGDGVHPNASGHLIIAEIVEKYVLDFLIKG